MRLGIDLDNTIICYDQLFSSLSEVVGTNKKDVKKDLMAADPSGKLWNQLQAKVYGPELSNARLYPGVVEFFEICKKLDWEIEILSHKTKVSNFDQKTPLRAPAKKFLDSYKIFNEIPVRFFETLDSKIEGIKNGKFDLFIDDLNAVLMHKEFPSSTLGLQAHTVHSFKNIRDLLLEFTLDEIRLLKFRFKNLPYKIKNLESSNSKVCQLYFVNGLSVISKQGDRKELASEYAVIKELENQKVTVIPQAILKIDKSKRYLYSALEGTKIDGCHVGDNEIQQMVDFISKLSEVYSRANVKFPNASYACFSFSDYLSNIERRILNLDTDLEKIDSYVALATSNSARFLNYCNQYGIDIYKKFPKEELILSPSDFGLHNMLRSESGLSFFDFEYFGKDDPAKLMADFYFHLGQNLSIEKRNRFIKKLCASLKQGDAVYARYQLIRRLIGIEWILIALNVFDSNTLARKLEASPLIDVEKLKGERMESAEELQRSIRNLV